MSGSRGTGGGKWKSRDQGPLRPYHIQQILSLASPHSHPCWGLHPVTVWRSIGAPMVAVMLDSEEDPPSRGWCGMLLRHLKWQPASTTYWRVNHSLIEQMILSSPLVPLLINSSWPPTTKPNPVDTRCLTQYHKQPNRKPSAGNGW